MGLDIHHTLQEMKRELTLLLTKRETLKKRTAEVERRITSLNQSINGLLQYAGSLEEGGGSEWGKLYKTFRDVISESAARTSLSEACRRTLKNSAVPLSAVEVRDLLVASGFSFVAYKSNPLSSIHTTLGRLKDSDEVVEKIRGGTKFYSWFHKSEPASRPLASRIAHRSNAGKRQSPPRFREAPSENAGRE